MTTKDLKEKGFVPIPESNKKKWINKTGDVFNIEKQRLTNLRRIEIDGIGRMLTPKIILWAYKGEKPRRGQIKYLNGNEKDIHLDNIKYKQSSGNLPERLNKENLKTALRCYFELDRNSSPNMQTVTTKIYLNLIIERRNYLITSQLVRDYLSGYKVKDLTLKHSLTIRDATDQINKSINTLLFEILKDKELGKLSERPYLKTEKERNEEITAYLKKIGIDKITTAKEIRKEAIEYIRSYLNNYLIEIAGLITDNNEGAKNIRNIKKQIEDYLAKLV